MMTTTTFVNRTAPYYAEASSVVKPKTDAERYSYFTDSIMKMVAFFTAKMDSEDVDVAMKAAGMLLKLETARLRHNRNVIGCKEEVPVPEATTPLAAAVVELKPEPVQPPVEPEDEHEFDNVVPAKVQSVQSASDEPTAMAAHTAEVMEAFARRAAAHPQYAPLDAAQADALVRRHLKRMGKRPCYVLKGLFVKEAMKQLAIRIEDAKW